VQKIWDLAKDSVTTEELRIKLLLATDNDRNTAWHNAANRGKLDVLQKIWDLAKTQSNKRGVKN
jgi:hypothetical protein